MTTPRLTLLTRENCHLCDQARAALLQVQDATGEPWQEYNVDNDGELAYEYGDRVPVILLDGSEHGYWTVDQQRLITDLTTARR
ncbi:MAG: glutaredoxin family protein [Corynebacteriales bacterium]|nr:glutaredoxin family protein [Mycobacteriales bacterium]